MFVDLSYKEENTHSSLCKSLLFFVLNLNGYLQDEVLCHRLGLLPLKVDARPFLMPTEKVIGINEHGVDCEEEPEPDPQRHIVFKLDVTCTKNKHTPSTATEPTELYNNAHVYTKQFVWQPAKGQVNFWKNNPKFIYSY